MGRCGGVVNGGREDQTAKKATKHYKLYKIRIHAWVRLGSDEGNGKLKLYTHELGLDG